LNSELYDEVTGRGPLETLLEKTDTINDILVNGPRRFWSNVTATAADRT